jgi:hypothetical protein
MEIWTDMSLWDAFRSILTPTPPAPKPATWNPTFRDDVAVVWGDQIIGRVAERYCATHETAERLTKILADLKPGIDYNQPVPFAPDSPTTFSDFVPWLVFPGGAHHNAGLLADSWVRMGGDLAAGERYCRAQIAAGGVQ